MKKVSVILLVLCLMPVLSLSQGVQIEGTVQPAKRVTLLAPYSGTVNHVDARPGDTLPLGHALLSIDAAKVYADFSGTVTAVFAKPGDSAASVQERYGALCYIERDELYTAACTDSGAASDNEHRIVHAGERLFVRSAQNESRQGEAIVTDVQGKSYTLLVTYAGTLRVGERIRAYRDASCRSDDCVGSGELVRVDPVKVTGEGYVLSASVQQGQRVSRGDLLFELVPEAQQNLRGASTFVALPQEAVILSVAVEDGTRTAKDDVLLTYCPAGEIELVCPTDEDDLADLAVGDEMTVTLDAYPDLPLRANITEIAAATEGENGTFAVTLHLEENAPARIGMNATASKQER